MANYYAANGASPGSGTIGAPWGIPDLIDTGVAPYVPGVALTTLAAGDTLYFRGGTYAITGWVGDTSGGPVLICPSVSGTLGSPITLRSYPGEVAAFVVAGGLQPPFGTISGNLSHIRFLGLSVDPGPGKLNAGGSWSIMPAFYIGGTGNEVGYCEIIGQYAPTVDNHDGIRTDAAVDTWIHHCTIHSVTGDGPNSAALKFYTSSGLLVEDNHIYENTTGLYEKEASAPDLSDQSIFRRNWCTGNTQIQFHQNAQHALSQWYAYDNVIDGTAWLGALSTGAEFSNNLIRAPGTDATIAQDQAFQMNIWNNIILNAGTAVVAYRNNDDVYAQTGLTAEFAYLDYNVYHGTPSYHFGADTEAPTTFTLAQIQAQGFETHAILDSAANIFVDETDYVLKGVYPTAGRYGDAVGPRYAIASIVDPTRYGPTALGATTAADAALVRTEAHDTLVAVAGNSAAALAATEARDTLAAVSPFGSAAAIARAEGRDTSAAAALVVNLGCLKVTCAAGQRWMARVTPVFGTLRNKTACSVAFWFSVDAIDANGLGSIALTGSSNPIACSASGNSLTLSMTNAAGTPDLSYTIDPLDLGNGHHVVLAYDGTLSTLYLDGVAVATQAGMGATIDANTNFRVGWDNATWAVTLRLADAAFWGGETLSLAEVVQLRNHEATPGSLTRPATNWWTLQGTSGATAAVSAGGLLDAIGTNHFDALPFNTGAALYDGSTISIMAAVLFMTPYVDTTGHLLFIPLYRNANVTSGGPVKPTSVAVDPAFTVAGSPVVPELVPLDGTSCFVCYQFATAIAAGQAVTMSCDLGWAATASGAVGGTGFEGIGATPAAVTNYAGQDTDFPLATTERTLKLGCNPIPGGGGRDNLGQAMANWARRIYSRDSGTGATNWTGLGTVTAFDANNLPTAIAGASVIATVDRSGNVGNGIDGNGVPGIAGTWTLVYGDATPGVTSDPATGHKLTIAMAVGASSWTISAPTVVNPGEWSVSDSCWHNITKTYSLTYKPTGGALHPIVQINVATTGAGGIMQIPILANGQSELGVFPPTHHGSTASTLPTFEPMAVCPTFMARVANAYSLRWMPTQALMSVSGDGNFIYASDLSLRTPTDFLMTNQATTILDVTRIDPVDDPSTFIVDYLNGDATGTVTVPTSTWTAYIKSRFLYLIETSAPHGLRTGDKYVITASSTARAAVIDWGGITLTAGVTTTGQTVFALNQTTNMNGAAGATISVGTILQIGGATTDEQVVVTAINGLNVTVTRAVSGTTALTKPSGTVCYICMRIVSSGISQSAYVVSPTRIFQFQQKLSIPSNIPDPTLLYGQAYVHGTCPTYTLYRPWTRPTMSYGHCAAVTSAVAAANTSGTCICWVSIPLMATDAAVTAAVNEMIPFLSAGVRLIVQLSNEVWNTLFNQNMVAAIMTTVAPNPETGGTGFANFHHYVASRQHHFTTLAKAAFTAASLDPSRVIWGQNGHKQTGVTQPEIAETLAYCQTHSLPVELIWNTSYADMTQGALLGTTYVSWLPASTGVAGAAAAWDLATTRAMIMSYYRACLRFGATMGATYLAATQSISLYNHGISVDGIAPANTNPVRARLCTYEGATTLPLPNPFPGGAAPIFPQCSAFSRDLIYDPAWYYTETAFYQAIQESARTYALLMTPAQFPDPDDAVPEFNSYFGTVLWVTPTNNTIGYLYPQYMWQGQPAGRGLGNLMGWHPTAPVMRDMSTDGATIAVNESVRGQAAIDWIGGISPTPTPTPTSSGRARKWFGRMRRGRLRA